MIGVRIHGINVLVSLSEIVLPSILQSTDTLPVLPWVLKIVKLERLANSSACMGFDKHLDACFSMVAYTAFPEPVLLIYQ